MDPKEKALAETVISESWMGDFDPSDPRLSSSEDEVYRLGLELATLRREHEELQKSEGFWKDMEQCEREKHHAWVEWQREKMGVVTTGPTAEEDGRAQIAATLDRLKKFVAAVDDIAETADYHDIREHLTIELEKIPGTAAAKRKGQD